MGSILNRYIFRETALTWLAVTGVLLLILLTDQFARVLDDAAGAQLPKNAILAVMALSSIQYLTILIPVGIFIAIMLALARMYRDSEMAAMMACGIGNISLYRPIVLLSILLAVIVGWLALDAGPSAQRQVQEIANEAKKTADLAMLEPGRFISLGREKAILYAEKVNDDGTLSNVFVQRRSGNKVIVVVAEKAGQRNDEELGLKVLTFQNGERYEGVPGDPEFLIMKFAEHGIPFAVRQSRPGDVSEEAQTLSELLDQLDPAAIAEIQWRISVPITLLVLTLIAVPLSRAPPRQGRYNNLIAGILLYIIYANLLGASKVWLEQERVPAWVGLWWVHLLFIAFAVVLLMRQNNVFLRLWRKYKGGQALQILNRYLFNAIAGATAMVILVLASLGVFIEFVGQLDDLGEGNYDLWKAIQYVALKMPRLIVGLLPVSVLLGSLLGLGALASGSELIIMRAAGISPMRMARSVAVTGIVMALIGGVVAEFMAPQMDLYARQMRAVAKSGEADITGSSAWLRDGNLIFNVRPSIDGIDFGGVYVFRVNEGVFLSGIGRGDSVQSDEDDEWSLSNYKESEFVAAGVTIGTEVEQERVAKLTDLLSITAVRESSLTGQELRAYVKHLKSNGLDADRYEIALWTRVATMVGVAVMCVLALPFVFGSLRSTGAGGRMIIGILIGLAYFLLNRTFADSSEVFDLSPVLVAWMPTVLLIIGTVLGLRRLR